MVGDCLPNNQEVERVALSGGSVFLLHGVVLLALLCPGGLDKVFASQPLLPWYQQLRSRDHLFKLLVQIENWNDARTLYSHSEHIEIPEKSNNNMIKEIKVGTSLVIQWLRFHTPKALGFPGGSDGKASACNAGDRGLIPGSGRSPGEGNVNPLQYSCLENSMDRGAWWATVHGVAKSPTWVTSLSFFSFLSFLRQGAWVQSLVRELDSTCCN